MMLDALIPEALSDAWYSQPWLDAAVAIAVAAGIAMALRRLTARVMARLHERVVRTRNVFDDVFLDALSRTRWLFHLAVGVWAGSYFVDIDEAWDAGLHRVVAAVVIIQVALWASGAVDHIVVLFLEHRAPNQDIAHRTGRNIMRTLGIGGVWTIAGIVCLDNFNFPVSRLVAGLGITGVAVALAGQQVGGDVFASASILLDQPFLVGDFIIVDGLRGTVERIGIRTTHLRSIDGERIVFANSDLAKSRVRNFKTMAERRVVFSFGIRHDTPSERIVALGPRLRGLFDTIPLTRFERATWHSFGAYALMYEVVYYVLDADLNVYMQTQQDVNVQLLRALEAEHVALAVGTPVRMVAGDEALAASAAGAAVVLSPPPAGA